MALDKKDKRILELLSVNCRFSVKSLARAVKLSKDGVRYRVNNLIKDKYIYKFLALVNFSAFGYDQYYVGLQLQNLTLKREKEIVDKLVKNPFVFFLVRTAGRFDLYMALACKGVQHFDRILREIHVICGSNLMDLESVAWLKDYKYIHAIEGIMLGTVLNFEKRDSSFSKELFMKKKEFEIKEEKIDRKDLQILRGLSEDPRIELKKLGKKVNLTGEGVRNRIVNLIKREILLGFTAVPDYFNLGYQTYFLLIQAKNLTAANEKVLYDFLRQRGYTIISFKTIGKYDILISVSVKNLNEFNHVLVELKDKLSDLIKTYESLAVLEWCKYDLFPEGLLIEE